jgi:hypothetical protein
VPSRMPSIKRFSFTGSTTPRPTGLASKAQANGISVLKIKSGSLGEYRPQGL